MSVGARRSLTQTILVLVLFSFASAPALAGTISIAWDPVSDPDLAGYRVFWGASPNNYTQSVDVGNVTSHTLTGLTDCTTWYVAVKAYDDGGNESVSYSNEISGWPRPELTASSPSSAEQGRRLAVTITGSNFQQGATVDFGDPNMIVNSVTVSSCNEIVVDVDVTDAAGIGAKDVDVTNPDRVFGVGGGLFTVDGAVAPFVQSTVPADGGTGVSVDAHPDVIFSEPMDPATVTPSVVLLLDSANRSVPQAAGSPTLSTDGRTATIVPAASLEAGRTYRLEVLAGTGGVLDLAGHPMNQTFLQPNGFTTGADSTPPVISSVQAGNVGSTTADISWSTDEDADSQVFYREPGQITYQQTEVDATLVTAHAMTLQGLAPSTTYEYHVRSADAGGNASDSSPDQTFTTAANSFAYIRFEAEHGRLTSPVQTGADGGAFQGRYVDTPSGTPTGTASSPAGSAVYGVNLPSSDTWHVWVRLYGPNGNADSWFESMDGAPRQALQASRTGAWVWVAARSYTLGAGLHSFELGGSEARARADRILVTNDPSFVPTEAPSDDNTAPSPVSSFSVAPADGRNDLSWTNPANGDFDRTVIRYRTDGRYPTSPDDGFAVAVRPAAPGSADSYSHQGLTNGTAYHYAAFALDAANNVSTPSEAEGTPSDNQPPEDVTNARRTDVK